ncbi:MAG: hypothetical protein SO170_03490 [Butyribacter sp.]|nr:hypothetical protein [bacterium]MDY3854016.1 hypothetical protein [Butyribacter sp.]
MKRITSFFVIVAILFSSVSFVGTVSEAKVREFTFENTDIPERSVEYTGNDKNLIVTVENVSYTITCPSIVDACFCDVYGTAWISATADDSSKQIYWVNYEIEGSNMSPHYFTKGEVWISEVNYEYATHYSTGEYDYNLIPLPSPDELRKTLETNNQTNSSNSSDANVDSSDKNTTTSTTPKTNTTTSTKKTTTKYSKVKKSGSKIKLLNSNGKAVRTVTFDKKKKVLTYKGKKIKNVKAVYFTKKGNIVYLKTNKKAYYLIGKKSTFIKKSVSSIKTKNGFATQLKLKNGKKVTLKK